MNDQFKFKKKIVYKVEVGHKNLDYCIFQVLSIKNCTPLGAMNNVPVTGSSKLPITFLGIKSYVTYH